MKLWKVVGSGAAVLVGLAALSLAFAPIVYAEIGMIRNWLWDWPTPLIPNKPLAGAPPGRVVDGYWLVQKIAPDTYAIGEPQNELDNFEYLLIGSSRALLIDAGATGRDIHPALATLTHLPITVIPTHLHSDHTNGLRNFSSIALIDLPETRSHAEGDGVHLGRYQYLGDPGQHSPVFRVTEWVKPGAEIDLGERSLRVLWTPGHTTNSISVYDGGAKLLFTGDLIYPTTLYAFLPDSSLSTYVATAERLLATLPGDTKIYGGHCCRNDAPPQAPWLDMDDLRDVRRAIENIRAGSATGRGFIIRRFSVNPRMTIVTLYPFGNR
jgi:glyoxylase-like metal-dependent hydrolase (beta-lactamase superfamily II)